MPCPIILANAGTPLMWASMLHMLIGNAVLGAIEARILTQFFKAPAGKTMGLMIPANYVSAFLGSFLINTTLVQSVPLNLYNAWRFIWLMVAAMYYLTLAIEWPFIAFAFRGTSRALRKSIISSLTVQTATYVPLFLWYYLASGVSLYTTMNIVPLSDISLPQNVHLYYISPTDGSVKSRSLTNPPEQTLFDLKSRNKDDRLFVQKSPDNPTTWDLFARLETEQYDKPNLVLISKSFTTSAAPDFRSTIDKPSIGSTDMNFGPAASFASAHPGPWYFSSGYWPVEGLFASNSTTDARFAFSLETPFAAWRIRNATHLPSDHLIFQLGDNQICILDPATKRIALITQARGPIVTLTTPTSTRPAITRPTE